MNQFFVYLSLGYKHITDLGGYDHLLFLVVLCGVFIISEWRKVLLIITAFTLGHSITLAFSVIGYINISSNLIEFIIPITIFLTAVGNLFYSFENTLVKKKNFRIGRFITALAFGLIHGLGFSNYLKSLLGKSQNIILELFAFNLGLEIGQIVIIFILFIFSFIFIDLLKIKRTTFNFILSAFVAGLTVSLIIDKNIF